MNATASVSLRVGCVVAALAAAVLMGSGCTGDGTGGAGAGGAPLSSTGAATAATRDERAAIVPIAEQSAAAPVEKPVAPPAASTPVSQQAGQPVPQPVVEGWLHWRGPNQNGTSAERGLPDALSAENMLWSIDLPGKGTPLIANGRVYAWGYQGEGPDLKEYLVSLDENTGKEYWRLGFSDFLSDTIYERYSIGSPVIDPRTGLIYTNSVAGVVACVNPEGKVLWRHSLMEGFGRLTFPNSRVGAPTIEGELVIYHGVTSNWGAQGPARDRLYAFDKLTGAPVWESTPGEGPPFLKDSSFSTPVIADYLGRRVAYVGLGCGNVACVDVRTGEPLWRFQSGIGGVNCSVVLHGGDVIAIHGGENTDSSKIGRMFRIRQPKTLPEKLPLLINPNSSTEYEVWRNDLSIFTSSPTLVEHPWGARAYQVVQEGVLNCVDAQTGAIAWHMKLGNSQLHASPLYADGKLYVAMFSGDVHVIRPGEKEGLELSKLKLEGQGIGSPAAWNGKVYVHTSAKLYCFGKAGNNPGRPATPAAPAAQAKAGPAVRVQVVPNEVLLAPGGKATFTLRGLDASGRPAALTGAPTWRKFIPPTAKVKVTLDGDFNAAGELIANERARYSAGAFEVVMKNEAGQEVKGQMRARILPRPPFTEDFEGYALSETQAQENTAYAYPPLPWIGARFKWDIRQDALDPKNHVLAKTLDTLLFQRAQTFIGDEDLTGYTIQADVMSEGNRRNMGEVGVICQRYTVALKGNHQALEVNSNFERVKVSVPFSWKTKTWYTVKARVDLQPDGSGVVKAKAWARGEPEPEAWTIEAPHKSAHANGSPGLYGLAPQNKVRVFVDNVRVTPTPAP